MTEPAIAKWSDRFAFIKKRPRFWGILGAITIGGIFVHPPPSSTSPTSTSEQKPAVSDPTIPVHWPGELAGRLVGPALKDASSAQYRDVTYRKRMGLNVLCGEVNALNSFGGYPGYTRFIVINNAVKFRPAGGSKAFARQWNLLCVLTDNDPAGARSENHQSKRAGLHRATERE